MAGRYDDDDHDDGRLNGDTGGGVGPLYYLTTFIAVVNGRQRRNVRGIMGSLKTNDYPQRSCRITVLKTRRRDGRAESTCRRSVRNASVSNRTRIKYYDKSFANIHDDDDDDDDNHVTSPFVPRVSTIRTDGLINVFTRTMCSIVKNKRYTIFQSLLR